MLPGIFSFAVKYLQEHLLLSLSEIPNNGNFSHVTGICSSLLPLQMVHYFCGVQRMLIRKLIFKKEPVFMSSLVKCDFSQISDNLDL